MNNNRGKQDTKDSKKMKRYPLEVAALGRARVSLACVRNSGSHKSAGEDAMKADWRDGFTQMLREPFVWYKSVDTRHDVAEPSFSLVLRLLLLISVWELNPTNNFFGGHGFEVNCKLTMAPQAHCKTLLEIAIRPLGKSKVVADLGPTVQLT